MRNLRVQSSLVSQLGDRALSNADGGRTPSGQETTVTPDYMEHHQWTPNSDQYSYVERGRQDNSDADSPVNIGPTQETYTEITL